jgi:hypothetical protein
MSEMSAPSKARRKRVFIASSASDVADVRKAMQRLDLDFTTIEEAALPGATRLYSLHRCLNDADLAIGILSDRCDDANVFFELGVASGLNKPIMLFVTPECPINLIPPSGVPYLRMDLRNEAAVSFGLRQALSLLPSGHTQTTGIEIRTRPIGAVADQLLEKLNRSNALEFEDIIFQALMTSNPAAIARGSENSDQGVDFAVWANDFEPMIANPLLIECKSNLASLSDVDKIVGQMFRELQPIPHGVAIVLGEFKGDAAL